jgi:hypothetical protein
MQQLRGLMADRGAVVAERDQARTQLNAITAERDSLRTQLNALQTRVTGYEQREAAHQQAAATLAQDRTDFDRMVSDGVITAQAQMGVPAAALPSSAPVSADETENEIFARWEKLQGKEKTEYYRKHKAVLSKPRTSK